MTRFLNSEMVKASKAIRNNIKNGNGLPRSIKMIDTEGKSHTVEKKYYNGLFESRNVFLLKNGRAPNYVTLNATANNPLVLNYQDDKYSCCVASFNMCVQMLYDWIPESKIKNLFKTNQNGTAPVNMVAGAKALGYKVEQIGRNFSSVQKAISKGFPVLVHYETAGKTKPKCGGFIQNYGHYGMIYGVTKEGYYLFADPTKGFRKCAPRELDNATNGRSLGYYRVGIL